jgi:hypothetical protein
MVPGPANASLVRYGEPAYSFELGLVNPPTASHSQFTAVYQRRSGVPPSRPLRT